MAKALALGIISVNMTLEVLRKQNYTRDLAMVHLYVCAFLLLQSVGMFLGKNHPQTWTLTLWGLQMCFGLVLLILAPYNMESSKDRCNSGILRSNVSWTTLHAITTQTLTQMACLSQINMIFCTLVFDLGMENTWTYQGTQYFLSFISATAAVFAVNAFRPKDVLVFAMAVVTAAYCGLGISFSVSNEKNQNAVISVSLALHSLLSCVFPVLLLISWIYTTVLFEYDFQPAGLSLAMASRWLVDACVSASFPLFLQSHKAVSFFALGAICLCSTAILIAFPKNQKFPQISKSSPKKLSEKLSQVRAEKQSTGSSTL